MKRIVQLLLMVVLTTWVSLAGAQGSYPDKPITLIVGFPAGQATDTIARLVAKRLSKSMAQPFVVENRPGVGGSLGLAELAKDPADGYTMMLAATASLETNPHLYKSVGYDSLKDFAPISLVAEVPEALVANPSAPFNTVSELIAYAKANPGKLSFSSPGNGTLSHLAMELFMHDVGISMVHVPYQGSPHAINDLIAGNVELGFDTVTVTVPQVKAKRLKMLAVASDKRILTLPDVPTMIEAGVPGFTAIPWVGMVFPKGTPADIVQRVNSEIRKAIDDPDMQKSLLAIGAVPRTSTVAEFQNLLVSDYAKWGKVIHDSGIKIN